MPGGNTTRRHFMEDDFNPHLNGPESAARRAWFQRIGEREKFARGAEGAGELQVYTHIQPFGQRAVLVHPPDDPSAIVVAPKNSGLGAFAAGQAVLMAHTRAGVSVIGEPPFGERGISEQPAREVFSAIDVLILNRAAPNQLEPGDSKTVTFFGIGFESSPVEVLKAVKRDFSQFDDLGEPLYVDDTLVTVGTVTFISDTQITALVTVDFTWPGPDLPRPVFIQIDYRRG